MSFSILEPDNFKRNATGFIATLLIGLALAAFYFMSNRGCNDYAEHLATCTPYKCSQRVMGFDSKYIGHTAITLSREIIGMEKDEFFDTSTCKVIAIDDITKNEQFTCKYSAKTLSTAVIRAGILFGSSPLPQEKSPKELSGMEREAKRAGFASRTAEQMAECVKSGS